MLRSIHEDKVKPTARSDLSTKKSLVLPKIMFKCLKLSITNNNSILVNDFLCVPIIIDSNLYFFNTKTGKSIKHPCQLFGPIDMIKLNNMRFAVIASNGGCHYTQMQIWEIKEEQIAPITEPHLLFPKLSSFHSMQASPDGRFLTQIEQRDSRAALFFYDCNERQIGKQTLIQFNPNTCSEIKTFVFTGVEQCVLLVKSFPDEFSFNTKASTTLYKFSWDACSKEFVPIFKRTFARDLFFDNLFPSPDGKQWLLKASEGNFNYSFYLLNAEHTLSALKKVMTINTHSKTLLGDGVFWCDDKIIFAWHSSDKNLQTEIYDCRTTKKWRLDEFPDIGQIIEFHVTDDDKIFLFGKKSQYTYLEFTKNPIAEILTKSPENQITPFINTLEKTHGIKQLPRQLHCLIQDYARTPLSSLFRPAKKRMPEITLYSLPGLIDHIINKLQLKELEMRKALPDKRYPQLSAQQQQLVKQLAKQHYDLIALNLLKHALPKHQWNSMFRSTGEISQIKSHLENIIKDYKNYVSYGLLQFFESVYHAIIPEHNKLAIAMKA